MKQLVITAGMDRDVDEERQTVFRGLEGGTKSTYPKPDFNLIFNGFFHTIIQETKEVITRERFDCVHGVGSSNDGDGIRSVGADKGYGMIGVLVFDEKSLEEAVGNPNVVWSYRFRSIGNEYWTTHNHQ